MFHCSTHRFPLPEKTELLFIGAKFDDVKLPTVASTTATRKNINSLLFNIEGIDEESEIILFVQKNLAAFIQPRYEQLFETLPGNESTFDFCSPKFETLLNFIWLLWNYKHL